MKLNGRFIVLLHIAVILVGWYSLPTANSQLLSKPNRHSAVEFLLATGILAKLLDIRNKHGHHGRAKARNIIHAVIGSARYPRRPRLYTQARYHPNQLFNEEVLNPHASLTLAGFQDSDLVYTGDRNLLAKSQLLLPSATKVLPMLPPSPILPTDYQLMAAQLEAQQKLLAVRQARNMLIAQQARKLLVENETRKILAKQQQQQQAQQLLSTPSAGQFLASSKANKELPPSTQTQSAQSRQLILDDELGELIARGEAFIPSAPEIYVANPSGAHPEFLSQEEAHYLLRRQDLPFYDDEFLMRYIL